MNSKTGISIRSYVPQLHGLPESLTDLKTISEELDMRFGQITLLQIPSSEAIIFYKQTEASQLEVHNKDLLQAKERLKLNDPHIIAMLDFTAGKLKKGGKTSYYVRGYYEYPNGDLLKEITHRRSIKRPFSLSDLVGLLSDLSAAGALLQRQRMVHGDIRPKYVTYNATLKKFQLMDRLGDPAPPLQAQLHNYLSATDLYMSPVIFHNFTQNISKFKHNPYKSEAFSVAMVVLETGLMTGLRHLYDEAGFCEAGLKECIRKLESQVGGQGRGFIDALRKITIIDESHRMDLLELHDYMRRTKVMTMLQRRPSQESLTQINVSKSAKSNNFASAAHSKTGEPINNRSGLHGAETSGMKSPQGNIQSLRFSEKTDVFHSPPQNFDLEMPIPQVLVSKKISNTRMPLRADEEFEQPARNGSIIPSRGSQSQYRQAQEDDQIPFCGQVHRVSAQNGCSTQNQDASQNQYTHQYNLHQGQGQDYSQLLDTPQFEVLEARQTSQDSRLPNNQYHVNNNYNGVNGQIKRETNSGDVYGQIRNTSDDERIRHQNTNYMQNPTEANHLSSIQAGQPSFNTSFQLNNVREDQIEGGPTGQEMGAKFSRRDIDQQEYPIDGYNYHDVRNDDGQNMNNNIGNDEVNSENFNGVGNDHQQEEEEPAFHGKVFRMGIESGCGSGDANPQHSKDTVSSPGILPSNHQNQFSGYDSFNQSPNQNNGQYDHSNNDQGDYNIEYQESPQVSYQPKNIQKAQKTIENPTNPKEYKNDQNDNQKKSSNSRHSRQNSSEGQKHPRVPLDSEGKGETISKEVISRSNSINNPGGHTSKRSLDGGILKTSTQFAGTTGSVSVQNFDEFPSNNLAASREPSIKNVRIREDPGLVKKSIPTAEDKEVEEVEFVSAKYDPAKRPSSRSGSRKGKGKEQNEGDHQSEGKASPLIASKGSKGNGQGGLQGAENGEDFADDLSRLAVRSRPNLKAVSTTTHEANPTISQGTSPIKQPAGKFTDREQIREDQRKPQTTARATSPFPSQKSDNSRVSSAKRSRADEPIFYTTVGGKASGSVSPKPTSERGKFTSPAVQIRNSDYHQQARSSVKVSATSSKKLTEDKRSSPIPMRAGAELEVEGWSQNPAILNSQIDQNGTNYRSSNAPSFQEPSKSAHPSPFASQYQMPSRALIPPSSIQFKPVGEKSDPKIPGFYENPGVLQDQQPRSHYLKSTLHSANEIRHQGGIRRESEVAGSESGVPLLPNQTNQSMRSIFGDRLWEKIIIYGYPTGDPEVIERLRSFSKPLNVEELERSLKLNMRKRYASSSMSELPLYKKARTTLAFLQENPLPPLELDQKYLYNPFENQNLASNLGTPISRANTYLYERDEKSGGVSDQMNSNYRNGFVGLKHGDYRQEYAIPKGFSMNGAGKGDIETKPKFGFTTAAIFSKNSGLNDEANKTDGRYETSSISNLNTSNINTNPLHKTTLGYSSKYHL